MYCQSNLTTVVVFVIISVALSRYKQGRRRGGAIAGLLKYKIDLRGVHEREYYLAKTGKIPDSKSAARNFLHTGKGRESFVEKKSTGMWPAVQRKISALCKYAAIVGLKPVLFQLVILLDGLD